MSDENHHRHREIDCGSVVEVDPPPNADGSTANEAATANGDVISNTVSESSLAKGLSSIITSVIKDFDSKAEDTVRSQDQLSFAIDRLTRVVKSIQRRVDNIDRMLSSGVQH
ncbi:hypothetical protein RJ639_036459, partial [Escallonia herrerae]